MAHAETFIQSLQSILFFEVIEVDQIVVETLKAEENAPIDIHFESVGYQYSDAFLNLGPVAIVLVLAPIFALLNYIGSRLCCQRAKVWCRKQHEKTFFNRIYGFFDGSFLLLHVSSTINIYQVYLGVIRPNSSYYFSVAFELAVVPCLLLLTVYLYSNFKNLNTERLRNRIGVAYQDLSLQGAGRLVICFLLLSFARRAALGFVVTFGRSAIVA